MKVLPTLRQLRYLVTVAECGHFGRAADDCAVTQSTLSAGIRELETVLGVTLIDRGRHGAMLTPLGEEIAARARSLLRAAEDLVDTASAGGQPLTGLLRLGVIPTVAPYLLPRAMPAIRERYPRLVLYLREEQTRRLLALVDEGRIDAALLALPYDVGDLETMILGEDRLVVACRTDTPLAAKAVVRGEDLADQPLLLLEDGHCLREHVLTSCPMGGQKPDGNEAFQATSMSTLVQMVANGLGITLLPSMAVELEARRTAGIAAIPLAAGPAARQIALVWRRGAARAADFRALGEAIRPHLKPGDETSPDEERHGHRPAPAQASA